MPKIINTRLLVEFDLNEDFETEDNANLKTLLSLMFSERHLGNSNFETFLGKPKIKVIKERVYETEEDVTV